MITRRKVLSIAGVLAAVVAVGACSSSNKSSSSAPTSGGQSSGGSTQATGAPIKVGEVCSCSGAPGFSDFSVPVQQAVKAWANSVNASGGINGHPIQLMTKDDGTNPGNSATAAQALISDHVVAIIDDTTLVQAWASAAEAAKIPVVGTYTINAPFDSSPDFYPEGQTNLTTLQAIVATAKQAGASTIGNMYCAEAPICAQSVPFMKSAGKS
ncbi:MAG: ABC transporter substrate-binding protein, partial [Acidimicrobiaceae bacterium]|nr:ABC transporter substrate-binding protein [Acidimicrobiaceae bacterium]